MIDRKTETFGKLMKEFKQHFTGPTSDLVRYLITHDIMTATDIAKQMGISRANLYEKYLKN